MGGRDDDRLDKLKGKKRHMKKGKKKTGYKLDNGKEGMV
jgi:hypothetical protein